MVAQITVLAKSSVHPSSDTDDGLSADDNFVGSAVTSAGIFGSGEGFAPALFSQPLPPPLAAVQGQTSSTSGAGSGQFIDPLVTRGNVTFDLKFVASDNPTAAFMTGVENAAAILAAAITVNHAVTFNIVVDYGKVGGKPDTGGDAVGGPITGGDYIDYALVRSALITNAAAGDANFNALPTGTTAYGYSSIQVFSAQEKVLGLGGLSPTATADDSTLQLGSGISDDRLVGVALHELAHGLGRIPAGPPYSSFPDIFDLTRFTAQGAIYVDGALPSPGNPVAQTYFSVDGGKTTLDQYGTASDPSDFLNSYNNGSNANDPFNEIYDATTVQGLTQLDLTQLDVLGFNTSAAVPTPCYLRGTSIRTESGDRPVERLAIGDRVVNASGHSYPIVWIGHCEVDVARHPEPASVRPVRVSAGAFGGGLPYRDLWLSPGHSVACDGALIPIKHLLNGRSVAQVDQATVEYWHVELDAHDILLAEGLPAESYLDTGNREAFENGAAFFETHADAPPHLRPRTCLPLFENGAPVAAAKSRLLARLGDQGYAIVGDAEPHVVADGLRIEPIRLADKRLAFAVPAAAQEISLRSKTFVPAEINAESTDPRELGLCIGWLQIDGEEIALEREDACGEGWRTPEFVDGIFAHRWTVGATPLPAGVRLVILDLAGEGQYWRDPKDNVVALSDWLTKRGGDRAV
jgi:hypothetical protein